MSNLGGIYRVPRFPKRGLPPADYEEAHFQASREKYIANLANRGLSEQEALRLWNLEEANKTKLKNLNSARTQRASTYGQNIPKKHFPAEFQRYVRVKKPIAVTGTSKGPYGKLYKTEASALAAYTRIIKKIKREQGVKASADLINKIMAEKALLYPGSLKKKPATKKQAKPKTKTTRSYFAGPGDKPYTSRQSALAAFRYFIKKSKNATERKHYEDMRKKMYPDRKAQIRQKPKKRAPYKKKPKTMKINKS